MLALAAPLVATTLTGPSAQAVPPGQQSYDVNRYVEDHFGRASTESTSLVVRGAVDDTELGAWSDRVASVPGVEAVAPFTRAGADVAWTTAVLDGPALDERSQDAVREIRALDGAGELLVLGQHGPLHGREVEPHRPARRWSSR